MAESDDPLDRQVSIRAELTQSGVNAAAQSRAVAALDSLCGGLIDLVGAPIDGVRRRQRAKDRVREALIVEEGKLAIEELHARRGLERQLREIERNQLNREAVAVAAVEQLKLLPPPAQSASGNAQVEGRIDEDWLHVFGKYAEASSAEEFTSLWGRILAGEVVTPGSFSRSTLRVVAELDQGVANSFNEMAKYRLPSGLIPHVSGEYFDPPLIAQAGLIQDVTGMAGSLQTAPDGQDFWREGDLVLISERKGTLSQLVPGFVLTRAGREIASIFPSVDIIANMKFLGRALAPYTDRLDLYDLTDGEMKLIEVLYVKAQ